MLHGGALALCLGVLPVEASLISLGDAANWNALVLGDMTGRHSDVEGRLAVGGNADLNHFNIGLALADSNGTRDDLVVGGTAEAYNGRVNHGNGVYGGALKSDTTFGFYSDDDPATTNGAWQQRDSSGLFSDLRAEVTGKATRWAELAPTGRTARKVNEKDELWEVEFLGDRAVNIFHIEADVLASPHKNIRFTVPDDAIALVNVSGESATLANSGFFHDGYAGGKAQLRDNQPGSYRHDGRFTDGILFNFFEADSLSMHSIGIKGSVLAPFADLSFYNGHIDGNLIVNNWLWEDPLLTTKAGDRLAVTDIAPRDLPQTCTGCTGQVNDYRFRGQVPAPATLLLVLAALPALRLLRRQGHALP